MKKVLHVIAGMNAGGMENMIMNYYRNLDRNKFQFDFLINDKNKVFFEDEIISLGGKIYRVPSQRENFFKNHFGVKEVIKNNNYDIIHVHQGITYYYPLKCAMKYGVSNRIVHNHGINRSFLKYLKLYNDFYARKRISFLGNNFIACSTKVLNHIFSRRVIENHDYTILPNAIDIEKFQFNAELRKKIRSELGIKDEKVFIHVGTFTVPKNHIFLIDVFNEYYRKNSNCKLILVGSGELEDKIRNKVNEYGLEDEVMFMGVRKDIPALLSCADVMLFPSLYEGLPLVLIEAQASGINVIASSRVSDECEISDLIRFVDIDNVNDWVNEIDKLNITKDRKQYWKLLENSDFSIKRAVKKLEKLYNRY